jgi:hypothetical protein
MEKWNWPFFSRNKATVTTHFLREDQLFAAKIWSKIIPKSGEKIQSIVPSLVTLTLIRLVVIRFHLDQIIQSATILLFFTFLNFLFFHFVPKFPLITCGKFDMIESDKGEQSHWNYYCFGSHQMLRWFGLTAERGLARSTFDLELYSLIGIAFFANHDIACDQTSLREM